MANFSGRLAWPYAGHERWDKVGKSKYRAIAIANFVHNYYFKRASYKLDLS